MFLSFRDASFRLKVLKRLPTCPLARRRFASLRPPLRLRHQRHFAAIGGVAGGADPPCFARALTPCR